MKRAVLVLAFLAISVNAMGQTRCADENGMPIECPPLIRVVPKPVVGPVCTSCPNLKFLEDWLFRRDIFTKFRIFTAKKEDFDHIVVKEINLR